MNITPKNLDSFDKYYEGSMSAEEQENFEMALKSNAKLHASFREYMNIVIGIHEYGAAEMLVETTDRASDFEEKKDIVSPKSRFSIRPYLFVAAAVFACFFVSYPVQDYLTLNNMAHAFGKKAQNPMGSQTISSRSPFSHGLVLRDLKQYDEALEQFEDVEKTSDYYEQAQFEKALIYIYQRKQIEADQILKELIVKFENESSQEKIEKNKTLQAKIEKLTAELATVWFWF